MAEEETLSIGVLADLLETTPRTLRFYEEEGLLTPGRSPGGTRRYGPAAQRRAAFLVRLTRAGVELDRLRALAGARSEADTGAAATAAARAELDRLAARLDEVEEVVARTRSALDELGPALATCAECRRPPTAEGCPDCPVRRLAPRVPLAALLWGEEGDG